MPIYEYECAKCQDIIEAWQSVSDEPMTTCPKCAGTLRKLISASSFQLKGGGWYADGYSAGGSCAKASGGNGSGGNGSGTSSAGGCSGGSSSCGGCC